MGLKSEEMHIYQLTSYLFFCVYENLSSILLANFSYIVQCYQPQSSCLMLHSQTLYFCVINVVRVTLSFFPRCQLLFMSSFLQILISRFGTFLPRESECMGLLPTSICPSDLQQSPTFHSKTRELLETHPSFCERLQTAAPGCVFIQVTPLHADVPLIPHPMSSAHKWALTIHCLGFASLKVYSIAVIFLRHKLQPHAMQCEASVGERVIQPVTSEVAEWPHSQLLSSIAQQHF